MAIYLLVTVNLAVTILTLIRGEYHARRSAEQFAVDDGTSLRDAVDRLESAAAVGAEAAEKFQSSYAIIKELGFQHKDAIGRVEAAAVVVATDLEASHQRANDAGSESHGAAADAAMRTDQ